MKAGIKFIAGGISFWLLVHVVGFGLGLVTHRTAIPSSCRQPSSIVFDTTPSRPAYGLYAVSFARANRSVWRSASGARIGALPSSGSEIGYGLDVDVTSTDIGGFRCRWSARGVTIIEPPGPVEGRPGIEHFVPAVLFLGGR